MPEGRSSTTLRTAATLRGWLGTGRRVVLALLVEVEDSAPLEPGAAMAIAADGAIEGSVTGGCVEAALLEEAREIFAGGPARTVTYGISDELAGTVGLTCGGTVHVFLQELAGGTASLLEAALGGVADEDPVAVATLLDGPSAGAAMALIDGRPHGGFGRSPLFDHSVARDAEGMLAQGRSGVRRYAADGSTLGAGVAVHVWSFAAPPRMLIFGAIDFSAALARIAGELGYRVTISDPRAPFLEAPRFQEVATIAVGWPEEALAELRPGPRDAVLVFSHDPKLDQPAVRAALAGGAGYVGALGSRETTADRRRRLREDGVGEADLERLHAPAGLDIGSSTPEEVAISVLAEVIAVRSGRHGEPLREAAGAIHPRRRLGDEELPE